jgi:hypothetical protein
MERTMIDEAETPEDHEDLDGPFDKAAAQDEAARGAGALKWLHDHKTDTWERWSQAIKGWRSLRLLAFDRAGTNDHASQAYRDAMSGLLGTKRYAVYGEIDKPTRSAMTRLIPAIEAVDEWYVRLPVSEQQRWHHPTTIAKHYPRQNQLAGPRHNQPRRKKGKKKKGNPDAESLRALLIEVITKYVMPVDPEAAKALLGRLYTPMDELNDELNDDLSSEPSDDEVAEIE